MLLHGTDYSGYSNAQLDQVYSDAYNGFNTTTGAAKLAYSQTMSDTGIEIVNRLQTPLQFVTSLWDSFTGGATFPLYNAIQQTLPQGFVASQAASSSVAQYAGNLLTQAEGAATSVLSTGKWLGIGVGLAALAYIFTRRK